jgi:hypothetical protein
MVALEGKELLRLAIIGGVLGFAVFCASYSLLVWRRRNVINDRQPSRVRRFAYVCIISGTIGLLGTWAFSQLEKRDGIVQGSDLYVVHARQDVAAVHLTPREEVQDGDVIAEFVLPANQRQRTLNDLQQAHAQMRAEAARAQSLVVDQALVQREAQTRSQIAQKEGFIFDLKKSQREVEKARAVLLTEWIREKKQIELEVARLLPVRPGDVELELNKRHLVITSFQGRLHSLEERYNVSDARLSEQLRDIQDDIAKLGASVKADEAQLAEIQELLRVDQIRAKLAVEREAETTRIEASIVTAERERFVDMTQMKAPFSGRIVFRHPTPELAPEGVPILALSAGPGFVAQIRMPRVEADQIASSGKEVLLGLERPVLHNIITGHFIRAEPLSLEDGQAIAFFECALPSEVVASFGNLPGRVGVNLLWSPPLLSNFEFQASAMLFLFGVFCFMFSSSLAQWLKSLDGQKGLGGAYLREQQ